MTTIETNIPMPRATNAPKTSKYPLHTMAVGDSFLVHVSNSGNRHKYQSAVMQAAWKIRATGKRFTSRQVPEGVRVWRVK